MIRLRGIQKTYPGTGTDALRGIDLDIHEGEFTALTGPSGSGKSTLMNIIGCLGRPSSGSYTLSGRDICGMSGKELSAIRLGMIGFVFQAFHLLPFLTASENIELPLYYLGTGAAERHRRSYELLEKVGLSERAGHMPGELSGGQMQRIAIARAMVNGPRLLLADEPTGNLDRETGSGIMALFDELHRSGTTIVFVTHDAGIAKRASRIITMENGIIKEDTSV